MNELTLKDNINDLKKTCKEANKKAVYETLIDSIVDKDEALQIFDNWAFDELKKVASQLDLGQNKDSWNRWGLLRF